MREDHFPWLTSFRGLETFFFRRKKKARSSGFLINPEKRAMGRPVVDEPTSSNAWKIGAVKHLNRGKR